MTRFLCAVFLTCISLAVNAAKLEQLQQQVLDRQLWLHPEWLNLVHYEVEDADDGEYLSQVDDARFFSAKDGVTNPKSELLQTLEQFFDSTESGNLHALCRYPARLAWLQGQLNFNKAQLPTPNCVDYDEWRQTVRAKSVTLVFPAYHLNSPSSMFGHTLLRLDHHRPDDSDQGSELLSFAVNFGADINNDDNSIFYAFKGLSGGYPGIFITTPYYNKIREYNRDENRDIWEYPLNLSEGETKRMVRHLWELKEINFDYYFFDENCSYRLLELLEVARPGIELTDQFGATAIPVDTVRAIKNAGLVEGIDYRPSRVTALQHQINQIDENLYGLIIDIAKNPEALESQEFLTLASAQQNQVVSAAYQYFRYLQRDVPQQLQPLANNFSLLKALNTYPLASSDISKVPVPIPPDYSHLSKRFTVAAVRRDDTDFAVIGFKPSFHDLEDNLAGFLRGAEINLGDVEISIDEDDVELRRFDVVDIFSVTPRNRFFDPLSWRVRFGLERQFFDDKNRLVTQVSGGAGVATNLGTTYLYAMMIARLEHNNRFDQTVEPGLGVHSGILAHFDHGTGHFEVEGYEFANEVYRVNATYTHNIVLANNHSLKLKLDKQWQENIEIETTSLGYQYFF